MSEPESGPPEPRPGPVDAVEGESVSRRPEVSDPTGAEIAEGTEGSFVSFWRRHRTLFWTVHSLWALATGVFVVYLARERYSFVPWVVLFLALTWASTLYFNRRLSGKDQKEERKTGPAAPPTLGEEATSYATRTMYQETLFFLLPFYAYSTVFDSANVIFLGGLGLLAVLSCLDLVFDRWLRGSPLAHRGIPWTRGAKARAGLGTTTFLVVTLGFPSLVPPCRFGSNRRCSPAISTEGPWSRPTPWTWRSTCVTWTACSSW